MTDELTHEIAAGDSAHQTPATHTIAEAVPDGAPPTVLITGITGTLGQALGEAHLARGWRVLGVTRRELDHHEACSRVITSHQASEADARGLVALQADRVYLNAGQIEAEIGPQGQPLVSMTESITRINYLFPAFFTLIAAEEAQKPLDIVLIGSIADGSPSAFGPLYHASKIALHYFATGTGPILHSANPQVRVRLYRPGAIYGPLSWAPTNRLNERGYKIRAKRCESAPKAAEVAERVIRFTESRRWVGTYGEPLSFRFLKQLFIAAPNLYYRLQLLGWRKASKL
ncbi:MAG: SDR family NAD(P)-dependent oxidoreductase, partial [Candidatus Competibacterales bacterium]